MKRNMLSSVGTPPLKLVLPALLLCVVFAEPALAVRVQRTGTTISDWCLGQAIANSRWIGQDPVNHTLPAGLTFAGPDFTFITPLVTADGYWIQLNYWDSEISDSSIGYSSGISCINADTAVGTPFRFRIATAADASKPRPAEVTWGNDHSTSFPWLGHSPFFFPDTDIQTQYPNGSTAGGPTGYPSIWLGCSWDAGSCTPESSVPWFGLANAGNENPNTNPHILPRQLKHVTSIPATWMIDYSSATGTRTNPLQVWDASFDIWFDKKGDPQTGRGTYGPVRGQNDGLEIMVWMDHNHSYTDGPDTPTSPGGKNANGHAQPSGWPREIVRINNVDYDVWTARLNNPYFGYVAGDGSQVVGKLAEPFTCPTLAVNNDPSDRVCGTEWNVVSFISHGNQRSKQMSLDAKVFADYVLGKNGGPCSANPNTLWCTVSTVSAGPTRDASGVLVCPASSKPDQQTDPLTATIPCLDENWILTSVQAGFEPWVGGDTLTTTAFTTYALVTSSVVQSGRTSDPGAGPVPDPHPVVFWGAPFEVVYNGCAAGSGGSASFNITLDETGAPVFPTDGSMQDMGAQKSSGQFSFVVPPLAPSHGPATVHFTSSCGAPVNVPIFIDPSGQVFYSDGTTPAPNAKVTLLFDPSGTPVPDHNVGLVSPVMQPDDNTYNPMPTDRFGSYGWNVVAGDYRVRAEKEGCGSVISPVQHVVADPITGLNLILPCAPPSRGGGSGNLNVTLAITNNWTTGGPNGTGGYCANLVGTNNTSAPLDWTTVFTLTDAGTIYDHWNGNFIQAGNTVTVSGIEWNNILQPGESLRDVGFCVNRGGVVTPNRFRLSVSKAGSGSGTVSSLPAGISCGGDCTEDYTAGTLVTLTATPAAGSTFAGWGGVCSGTGVCTVNMSAARTVTATFNRQALTTRVNITDDWGAGYCANVVVTNNSAQSIDWKVTFTVVGRIYDFWNVLWSQSGSQVTAEGVSWNNILGPGQSTHDVGFCANR